VPAPDGETEALIEAAARFLLGRRVIALTGAGCSTESGIPDYRGPGRSGPPRRPILHDDFLRRPEVRRRYWARATRGWARFAGAQPNPAHASLVALERAGALLGIITQNVDRLHHQAGSQRVIELHGALEEVFCLGCSAVYPRTDVHAWMVDANPGWLSPESALAPDGDAELSDDEIAHFVVVACPACGGILKPNVVFFGGNVPAPTVSEAFALVDEAEALLVVGSSLEVYSGFRFVRRAHDGGKPVVIVNQGPTRGDAQAALRINRRAGFVLPLIAQRLSAAG
jgi:NAD+-dependent protein deacetylase sirtuin 4